MLMTETCLALTSAGEKKIKLAVDLRNVQVNAESVWESSLVDQFLFQNGLKVVGD